MPGCLQNTKELVTNGGISGAATSKDLFPWGEERIFQSLSKKKKIFF